MPAPKLTEKPVSSKQVQETTSVTPSTAKGAKADEQEYVYKEPSAIKKVLYSIATWLLYNIFHCFFREIKGRGSYKVPQQGPVIFVAAPHANQFVDPVILMGEVKKSLNRRVSFLVAENSLKQPAIGFLASFFMAIGVIRPQDNLKPARGTIRVDPEDYKRLIGHDTHFLTDCAPRGLIALPKSMGFVEIQSIESDTCLTLRKEFKMAKSEVKNTLLNGTVYKYADKVNQSCVYHRVFEHLAHNNCIGIFPEGGSHDRTDLLPLKAGVAIMALGCMDKHPDANVKIVPCGMNYFHPHKFRSRAVVEFGDPIEIPKELVAKYHNPETNRDAVKELLDTISKGLQSVTVTCSDYETLMVVQAIRRLYMTQFASKLPLPLIVEMNRRMVKGYEFYRNEPEIAELTKDIMSYNAALRHYNLPDHQVEEAKVNFARNLGLVFFRLIGLSILFALAMPGIIMFSPVFILAKRISQDKARTALSRSTVKIKANDVIATWKILIGMGFAPLLYIFWSVLITYFLRGQPWKKIYIFSGSYISCVIVTYSALIVGDIGMDGFKSLRPLVLSLTSPKGLQKLQKDRGILAEKIIEVVNNFGSELFPDFDSAALREEFDVLDEEEEDRKTSELKRRKMLKKQKIKRQEKDLPSFRDKNDHDDIYEHHQDSDGVSLVNSDNSLSNIPLFSTTFQRKSEISLASTSVAPSSSSEFEIEDEVFEEKKGLASKIAQAVLNKRIDEDAAREEEEEEEEEM
ncbi:hypothetical protein SUVZ_02G1050 [Saccharomyces uvarum]|uniref:Phospholipid/glycerol acyltransferase domain-containing protein n=1 Tax=Saccharomyces uvarum TaxID=230603 RepID=A0ABN8WQY2_SACUV|nr:hypothetical protein SUVZ_02G1050 [Saccharomyces uvarum]